MIIYPISTDVSEDIEARFTYHPLKAGQQERYQEIRAVARDVAITILQSCPESRERSLALTKLEESVMWANASIARNE